MQGNSDESKLPSDYCLRYVKHKGQYRLEQPRCQLKNNLLAAVGFFELANAGDFAANVWNAVPPVTIAVILMALGATGALVILTFAIFDLPRAWRNTRILRLERKRLLQLKQVGFSTTTSRLSNLAYIDVNNRELGNEVIDRLLMGILLGFGAFTVGVGTYL